MNLKTAARRLGVHYQTAYRWVRSGELVAVKVGSGYEISDAALSRFQAQRAAVERVPDVDSQQGAQERDERRSLDLLDAMVDQVLVDTSALEQQAARIVAADLGDLAVVRRDGEISFEHYDPTRAVVTGTLVHRGWLEMRLSGATADDVEPLFLPQVPQREVRPNVREEFHQFLDSYGLYSAMAVPVTVAGKIRGSLFAGRDEPGRPYTFDDRDFVVDVAARLSVANERAERAREAWSLRARLLDDLIGRAGVPPADWVTALRDDEAVAIAAPDTTISGATDAYASLFGTTVSHLVAIPDQLDNEEDIRVICNRMVDGEIDYFSITSGVGRSSDPRVMLHGGVVRLPDATPRCIVVVAHAVPEVTAA